MRLIAIRVDAGGVGQVGRRGYAGGLGVAGILEEILHRPALHAGLRTPRAEGIRVAFEVAVILRVRVDEHADCAALLGEVDLDAAEVAAVADDDDLAVQIDVVGVELIEVFEAAVVGVDHLAGHITRAGRAIEGHHDAGIVLARIALHMLAGGAGHQLLACCVEGLHADDFGPVEQHAVGHDLGFEAVGAKLLGNIERGLVVFGRGGHVRLGGERFQIFAGELGAGHIEECLFYRGFLAEVGVAEC